MRKIIIDCDPGMDDSMALVLALKSEQVDVLGITTVAGNYPIDVTTKNALKVVELLSREEVPVARGLGNPLVRKTPVDPFSHGDDGQANNNLPTPTTKEAKEVACDFIIRNVEENPGEVTIICCGPLSNLALAMIKQPSIKGQIKEVIAISGVFGLNEYSYRKATGDTPQSEWNVYVDPEAADIVYNSGVEFTALGLDIATHFEADFTDEHINQLKSSNLPEAQFLSHAIAFTKGRGYGAYTTIIDCLAVAHVIEPTLIGTIRGRVGIETEGKYSFGNTVLERRDHHAWEDMAEITIGESVNYPKFLNLIIDLVVKENT